MKSARPLHARDVYLVARADGMLKIGISSDVPSRVRSLASASGMACQLVVFYPFAGRDYEAELHARFASERAVGEWFHSGGEVARFAEREHATAVRHARARSHGHREPRVMHRHEDCEWCALRAVVVAA
jgi:Meiotically up-regulated gene 113